MKPILTIIGPTASGKTSLAVNIASELKGEIIGLDSRQIYKGMPIGTAQPTDKEKAGITHHLFGFRDPTEPISAGEYANMVKEKIVEIRGFGKCPIICGGAGLYFRALSNGIFKGSVSDLPTRGRLEQLYEENPAALLERLKSIDPDYADIVHINNKKRLIRALEIFETTGKPPSIHFADQKKRPVDSLKMFTVLINWSRDILLERIESRTDYMLEHGWINEVKMLIERQHECGEIFPALDSIGYRQIQSYLNNEISFDEMREEIIIKTRQFSRRQMQWFKKENIDVIIEMDNLDHTNISDIVCDLVVR